MVAIKQLGTNGGGYFGPNSAHPYRESHADFELVETWSIAIIPMAMVWTLGLMLGRAPVAMVVFVTMLALYLPMVVFARRPGARGNPAITAWASINRPGRWKGRKFASGPDSPRCGP
jgi:K+-transporting ATPase ATPase A chain